MSFEEALTTVNAAMQAACERPLSDLETLILEGAWQGKTYPQIADEAGYSVNYLTTDVGPKFWKALSQALGEPVNKKNFKAAIKREQERAGVRRSVGAGVRRSAGAGARTTSSPHSPIPSWGEAPDVSQFYGREEEQDILERWIVQERCRLIAILGMGGIGKSTLATKVAQLFTVPTSPPPHLPTSPLPHPPISFTHLIWRSLRNAPPLSTLLTDIVGILSDCQDTECDTSRLLHWLREKPCLLVLDNAETILEAGDHAGYYRAGYEDYGDFFRLVGETVHQSCVVLTSREKPAEIAALEGLDGSTRTLQLSGSVSTALALIEARGLAGTTEQRRELCDRYSYNPLALKIVSTTIQDLFDGEIGAFLAADAVIFNSIRRLLDQQFQRLSELEQSVMRWLAINRDWTEMSELAEDIVPAVSKVRLVEALESLKWRGLIETQKKRYTQQPVVMEYVTEHLVEQASQELATADWQLLHHHALMKATSRDYVTDTQGRLILSPVAEQLRARFASESALAQHLQQSLVALRQAVPVELSYGPGNLLNLCHSLDIDLTDYDFSGLTIRQADLRRRILQRVNFAQAHFTQSVFTETFGSIFSLCFSRDGEMLMTGDNVGHVRLWRSDDLHPLRTIQAHTSYIWHLVPSPDQRYLATCSEDHTVKVWSLATGELQATLALADTIVQSLTWIDVDLLAMGSIDSLIRLWHPLRSEQPRQFEGHQAMVSGVSWNPHRQILASSSTDGAVKLWDITSGDCLQTLAYHGAPVRDVAWSPDGQILASSGEDQGIVLWNPFQETPMRQLQGHRNAVWSIEWSPDGGVLASSSHDATIRLWDVAHGTCLRVLQGHQNWVWYARWHPTRPLMASGSHDGTLKLWNPDTGQCLKTLLGHMSNAWVLALSPDRKTLALGCNDMVLRLWDPEKPGHFYHLGGHTHMIADTGWSPQGDRLATASHDRTVRVWQAENRQCLKVLTGHENWVWSVDWHPTQALIASASSDNTVKLWRPDHNQPLTTLTEHTNWALAVRWHPEGHWLASCAADRTVRLWQPETWECRHVLQDHDHWVWRLAWSPDGQLLASGGYDHTARIWRVGEAGVECVQVLSHGGIVSAIAWHPQANLLATGCHNSMISLWQPQTGESVAQLQGHGNQVSSLVFSADGRYLYSSSEDETIKIWDVATATCSTTTHIDRPYEGMKITDITGLTASQIEGLKALGAISGSLP